MRKALLKTNLPLKLFRRGKVRDIYDLGEELLIVCTDRISAFDVVMGQGIPSKGEVLNQVSKFWFKFIEEKGIIRTHFISDELPKGLEKKRKDLTQRIMIVRKIKVVPVEFIVRGFLAGSAWKKYQEGSGWMKKVWPNLKEGQKLPLPIIQHTTKAETGHDEEIDLKQLYRVLEEYFGTKEYIVSRADLIIGKSLKIYKMASEYAENRGVIIADTKFEFGFDGKELYLVDEVFTPDSSRFWLKEKWQPGRPQEAYDKQPLRDWLESTGWDKNPPPPDLSKEIIGLISQRYGEIKRRLLE